MHQSARATRGSETEKKKNEISTPFFWFRSLSLLASFALSCFDLCSRGVQKITACHQKDNRFQKSRIRPIAALFCFSTDWLAFFFFSWQARSWRFFFFFRRRRAARPLTFFFLFSTSTSLAVLLCFRRRRWAVALRFCFFFALLFCSLARSSARFRSLACFEEGETFSPSLSTTSDERRRRRWWWW